MITEQPGDNTFPVFIDRIEDEIAVIIAVDDDALQFNVPLRYLPANVREGDQLKLHFELDQESTAATYQRVAELQAALAQDDDADHMNIKL